MALTPTCDRCPTQNCQLVSVLGVEICNACLDELRAFLATPPGRRGDSTRSRYVDQALRVCAAKGLVTALEIAQANSEPRRRAYYRLIGLAKHGKLVHLGGGVFARPVVEAAE